MTEQHRNYRPHTYSQCAAGHQWRNYPDNEVACRICGIAPHQLHTEAD